MAKRKRGKIILGVTGSIAAYRACGIINRLREKGHDITVVMTAEAKDFISPLTLQSLSGNRVVTDMFALPYNYAPQHTAIAEQADLVLVAPATANIIGRLASGICDDILTCVIMATRAPVILAPAMNDNMYRHKSVESNIRRLKSWGYKFIGPRTGRLVCGHRAVGHIADSEVIVRQAEKVLG